MAGKHKADAEKRVSELREAIRRHNDLYYNQAAPVIADSDYDALMAELTRLEQEHPELDSPDSPSHQVGAGEKRTKKNAFPPHRHAVPMLSISNTYSADEIRKFIGRVVGALRDDGDREPPRFVVELKIDGVAFTAFYRNGVFLRGATRGDGTVGEDITTNLKAVAGLPKKLKPPFPDGEVEVRGEIYMSSGVFLGLVEAQEEEGAARVFANPRNATAGTLKLLDSEVVKSRHLECFLYQIVGAEDYGIHGQADALDALARWGLPVNPRRGVFATADEVIAFRDALDTERHHLDYGTDGLVIKLDSFRQQDVLGLGSRSPNWAVAYKFAPERAETVVENIRVQGGKLGRLTPVADFVPVTLAGSTITHASLHNESYIAERDIRVGDHVLIEKAGEIIPQVSSVNLKKRPDDAEEFHMPEDCPSCGHESTTTNTKTDGREIVLRFCVNPNCPAQQYGRIVHFASRDAMDIDGMGPAAVDWLLTHNVIRDVADIYSLTRDQLMPMTKEGRDLIAKGSADKPTLVVDNLLSAIEASKGRGLAKVLFALAIPDVGETAAQVLAKRFKDIRTLMATSERDIAAASVGESTSYRTLGDKTAAQLRIALGALPANASVLGNDPGAVVIFLESLKIPGFGAKKIEAVARHFGSIDRLLATDQAEIAMVEMGASQVKRTLGPVAARSLRSFLDDPDSRALLERLEQAGVVLSDTAAADGTVAGKTFVLTGTLPNLGRAEAKRLIEAAGGLVAGSVSRKVDYVVAGDEAGSKLQKATDLGIAVIDEAAMLDLLKGDA
ncbi:MAG: NAD-dependent DNA ligase LigA [Planctomycetaceae bacterium]|nr:NAD-dependent DNA ligase LigA [Planctomycetaceae bacterium]